MSPESNRNIDTEKNGDRIKNTLVNTSKNSLIRILSKATIRKPEPSGPGASHAVYPTPPAKGIRERVQAVDFLPQCEQPKRFSGQTLGWGLALMLLGLFEKIAVADGLLAPIVETVYDTNTAPDFLSAWSGTLAFSAQIFCDFAGYSTCAIGAAMCLGFCLGNNFHFPYAAVGFSDFWRRWHISLSSWLKDYLYIPLGGNRAGASRTYVNLMVTMLVGGLWHGASWTFVVWGGLHGLYLALERAARRLPLVATMTGRTPRIVLAAGTFLLVCVAWVFFRATSFVRASDILAAMCGLRGGDSLVRHLNTMKVLFVTGAMLYVHWRMKDTTVTEVAAQMPWWLKSCVLAAMGVGIALLSGEDHAFIYFQF
jgi:D-alanyl-lipoteichoic acid acyltransferase DltB (MBOAT superfamily)